MKRTRADLYQAYPDFGASFETFTNVESLEVGKPGSLTKAQPGESVQLVEHWARPGGSK